jgi:hypothetical protein
VLLFVGGFSLTIRRLHDMGLSGYHAIWVSAAQAAWAPLSYGLPEVMLAGLPLAAVGVWLLFWPGNRGPNRFGEKAGLISGPAGGNQEMGVFDDYLVDPKLSLLDKTRIQAQVLVPVLRALRAELGREKADAIAKEALRGWSKELFAAIGDRVDGSPRRKWAAMHSAMAEATEHDVTVEMRRHDKEALEFDITHCRFAEFFRALGEPELGALLICETDFDIAAAGDREVSFTRDQTIMQGAPSCTFRYKFAPR